MSDTKTMEKVGTGRRSGVLTGYLCFFGLHKWTYFTGPQNPAVEKFLPTDVYRQCSRCKRQQKWGIANAKWLPTNY